MRAATRKIRAYRALAGMSQTEVARRLGMKNYQVYRRRELGDIPFTVDEAKKLADLFGVSVDSLFFTEGIQIENKIHAKG